MKQLLYTSILLFITACGGIKKTAEPVVDNTPAWVKNYPVSSNHYVGIGIADKSTHPTNFMQIAQQNALQNLASQIKVNIATESVFLQMEREYSFEEEFKSDIKIKAQEHLEEYELMGTHTHGNEYWVYYQLSKSKWQEVRQARMEEAVEQAKTHLQKTTTNISLKEQYIHYLKALEVLKPFLSEPLETTFDRNRIYLASEVLARFRDFLDGFRILSLNKKIKVMVGNKLGDIKMTVEYDGIPQENIPLIFASDILDIQPFSKATDEKGNYHIIIPKITETQPIQKMEVGLDIAQWINEATQDKFIAKMARGVKAHQITVPVYVYTPLIYVNSAENTFGKKTKNKQLKFAAETALTKMGFTPTGKKDEAQLFMHIEADTEKGKQQANQKMFTAFLNINIQVKDKKDMIVFSEQTKKLKGIQLSFEQANTKAYQNAQEEFNKHIIPNFVDAFIK